MYHLPGLTALIGSSSPNFSAHSCNTSDHLITDTFSTTGLCGFLRRFPKNRSAGTYLDITGGKSGLVIDAGPDLRIETKRATPRIVFEAYSCSGPDFVKKLDGQFLLIAWQEARQEIILASDRYGLRPHYILHTNAGINIGTSASELSRITRQPLKLDERSIFAMLSYSRLMPGSVTCFESFEALPPATLIVWSHQIIREKTQYWDYFQDRTSSEYPSIRDIADAFKEAVSNSMDTGLRTGICLSGGLDSRLVVGAMSEEERHNTIAYTWGAKRYSDEVRIAKQVAECAKINWQFLKLEPSDFVTDIEDSVEIMEGRDHAIQGYARKIFAEVAAGCDVAATGLAFDILISGSYSSFLVDSNLRSRPFEQVKDNILERYRYFRAPLDQMFKNSALADQRICEVKDLLSKDLVEVSDDLAKTLDRFVFRQRGWRYLSPRQLWQRLFVEDVTPTYANSVVDMVGMVSSDKRVNYNLTHELLHSLDSYLMEISYQGTLLPVVVPVNFWHEAASIEKHKELLYRNIYYNSGGKIHLPYDRYYSNFDEWQRMDKSWARALDKYLLSDDSRLVADYLRREWVTQLIQDQRSGAAANFAQVNVLISLELLLRKFS